MASPTALAPQLPPVGQSRPYWPGANEPPPFSLMRNCRPALEGSMKSSLALPLSVGSQAMKGGALHTTGSNVAVALALSVVMRLAVAFVEIRSRAGLRSSVICWGARTTSTNAASKSSEVGTRLGLTWL
jgi:hypothetical protein